MIIDTEFDTKFADRIAKLESYNKHLYRPNTYLHKWWARRCGSTFRLILKHLINDPNQRNYYAPGGLEGKIILDPMMGGGTTLHEAIRLGANVVGVDIDPIPVLQAKATLSYIPLRQIEEAFENFFRSLEEHIGHLFQTRCPHCDSSVPFQFTLYGLNRACACRSVLFVDSTILRHEADGSVIRICPTCYRISNGEDCDCSEPGDRLPLLEKGISNCSECGEKYTEDTKTPFYRRYTPLALFGRCPKHGHFFRTLSASDRDKIEEANHRRPDFVDSTEDRFNVISGPKSADLIRRGITAYPNLFSSRQLLYIHHAIDLLRDSDSLIRLNLALLVSTSLEFNSMLCGYKGGSKRRPGAVRHTFSHHAYSFPHTSLENNMLFPGNASGTLQSLFNARIRRGRKWAARPKERVPGAPPKTVHMDGEADTGTEVRNMEALCEGNRRFLLIQGSSAALDIQPESVDFVVTDPPYFDSVQYSDLAAYFRIWLRELLPDFADWQYDVKGSAVDHDRSGQYSALLGGIFSECQRVLKKTSGRLIFTFHHWKPEGWAALTLALKTAGFYLVNRYVVHAENPTSVHIANLNALKHDAILVLSPSRPDSHWELPETVSRAESAQFCADSATALGWMLENRLDQTMILRQWKKLLP